MQLARKLSVVVLCVLAAQAATAHGDEPSTAAPAAAEGAPPAASTPPSSVPAGANLSAPAPSASPAPLPSAASYGRKRHPYGMLLGGAISFLLPYLTIVGVAAHYNDYNPNASRAGYIPLAGPFLARGKMSDKDLNDGFSAGLIADGVLQAVTAGLILGGAIWCGVGQRERPSQRAALIPLIGASPSSASLGLTVQF